MTESATMPAAVRYDLGPIDRIPPGEGQTFQLADREVAVFRTRDDVVYATQGRCPHKAGLLADGIMGAGKVICPLHSYKFDLVTGVPLGNACGTLRTYHVEVTTDRRVLIWLPRFSEQDWRAES
jgi:nitrite reductase (NADH) small subunit